MVTDEETLCDIQLMVKCSGFHCVYNLYMFSLGFMLGRVSNFIGCFKYFICTRPNMSAGISKWRDMALITLVMLLTQFLIYFPQFEGKMILFHFFVLAACD